MSVHEPHTQTDLLLRMAWVFMFTLAQTKVAAYACNPQDWRVLATLQRLWVRKW